MTPTILKLFTEIPKNLNSIVLKGQKQTIMKETNDAFGGESARSDKSVVMVKKNRHCT
jgi:hypothetical protein